MTRLAPLLLILALSAITSAQTPPRLIPPSPPLGTFPAGIDPKAADNSAGIQLAVDSAATFVASYAKANPGYQARGKVFIPAAAAPYRLAQPVYIDSSCVELVGEGEGALSKLAAAQGYGGPLVVLGVSRPTATDATWGQYRPDCFGKLDSSAAPAVGKRRGFRSRGHATIAAHGSVLTHGGISATYGEPNADNWLECPGLTVDLALEGFAADGSIPGQLFIGSGGSPATPWMFATGGKGDFYVYVSYQTAPLGPPVNVRYRFDAPGPGVRRISFQVDTSGKGPVFSAWVDGFQATITEGTGAPTSPCTLFPNPGYPFVVCQTPQGAWADVGRPVADVALYGLCLSRSLRYTVGAAGSAQVRADGQPISDRWRYFPDAFSQLIVGPFVDTWALAYFPFDDGPTPSRHLFVQGGYSNNFVRSTAFLMDASAAPGQGAGRSRRMRCGIWRSTPAPTPARPSCTRAECST